MTDFTVKCAEQRLLKSNSSNLRLELYNRVRHAQAYWKIKLRFKAKELKGMGTDRPSSGMDTTTAASFTIKEDRLTLRLHGHQDLSDHEVSRGQHKIQAAYSIHRDPMIPATVYLGGIVPIQLANFKGSTSYSQTDLVR